MPGRGPRVIPRPRPDATEPPSLVVADVFGCTVQGEGPSLGRRASFIRLGGCNLTCHWCTVPGMLIMRPDFTWTPVELLEVGDVVLGRTAPEGGKHGVLAESTVTRVERRQAPLIRVNGNLVCSADTRAWTSKNRAVRSGWREFTRSEGLNCTHLAEPMKRDAADYERGYVSGMADGDGSFWTLRHRGRAYRRFRLALNDQTLLDRTREYAARAGFTLRPGTHDRTGFKGHGTMSALWLTSHREAERFEAWVEEDVDSESWTWGYLAGMFDAEGTLSQTSTVRISQHPTSDDGRRVYERMHSAAVRLGFDVVREPNGIRLRAAEGEIWRFMVGATPAKGSALAKMIGRAPNNARAVVSVEDAGEGEVVALTTSTGNYIAEGWLVHNCDTPETWDARRFDLRQTLTRRPVDEIVARALQGDPGLVVITGGEPLLHQHQDGWRALIGALLLAGAEIEIETNGTVTPTEHTARCVTRLNVSPKLTHSTDPVEKRIRPDALAALVATGKAAFKFVCRTTADVAETALLAERYRLPPSRVWIMPEGTDSTTITRRLGEIADPAIAAGFNLTTRLHVLAWGDEKGR